MEKYRYIRKTVTWNHHRYEVRGKTEQEACDKLADLITTLKQGDLALAGSNLTVDQWFAQWRDTYKAPSGLTPKVSAFMTRNTGVTSAPPWGT